MALRGLNILSEKIKISEDEELISAHLERLIFTPINSIPGFPGIGSRVPSFFWEPGDQELVEDILQEISLLVQAYEPRISTNSIKVTIFNLAPDKTGLIIEIDWSMIVDSTIRNTTKFFKIRELTL